MKLAALYDLLMKPKIVLHKEREGPWTVRVIRINRLTGIKMERLGKKFDDMAEAIAFYLSIIEGDTQ